MATYNVASAKHATLSAATVDTVNLTVYGRYIQVVHRGTVTNPIYVTIAKSASDPTAAGDNTLMVLSGVPLTVAWPVDSAGSTVQVKLISAGAEPYSVQVLSDRLT